MNLGDLFKAEVHCLIIGKMIGLDHRNEVSIVSVLVCMITHLT